MHSMQIYNVENYEPFNFKDKLNSIYFKADKGENYVFSNKGYFAISEDIISKLQNKKALIPLEIEFTKKQGIVIGKINQEQSIIDNGHNRVFLKKLIQEEVHCLRYFLNLITAHLNQRVSEGTKLTNHDNVRILIGEVVKFIEEIIALLKLEELTMPTKKYIAQVIRLACNHLAKLAGGRSFISSNVIEMLCTFEALNMVYLH